MLPALLALSLSFSVGGAASAGADRRCAGVLDRTDECDAPANERSSVIEDPKAAPPAIPGMDPAKLPGELAFASVGLLLGGGAAVAWSYANAARTDEERRTRDLFRWSGAGLLAWSGLAAGGAFSLWLFDPSTGELRPKIFPERE
jgi:hypothetical protein